MTAVFYVHVELTDHHDVVWWAETPAVTGLTVAAASLAELSPLIDDAVRRHLGKRAKIALELVADEPERDADTPPFGILTELVAEPASVGPLTRRTLVWVP